MARKRPKGVLALGWACITCAATGRTEHVPTSEDYPDHVVKRISFDAGGGYGWKISALVTPRETPAPWKVVVITGSPSWAEYWAPVLAALPQDREMIVVDRPGFAASEPVDPVGDIKVQARALAPVLRAAPGQKVLLVGQSYGAAIATLMAREHPRQVDGLVLLSSFLGEPGPTAKFLLEHANKVLNLLPRDLRHAAIECSNQGPQLTAFRAALPHLRIPIHVVHGDADDFAPIELAEQLARETPARHPIRFQRVPGANHFLNDGPAEVLIEAIEAAIPPAKARTWRLPEFPRLRWLKARGSGALAQPMGA
ncbi:MAG TPA: alpha/beta hydrolase [Phenylobacterium sp.]